MVKLFVGNLGDTHDVTSNDLRLQFEKYGSVTECERIKNFAFVHMDDAAAADRAQQELNGFEIKGIQIRVEMSGRQNQRGPSMKLFVGNLAEDTTAQDLRELFEKYTRVLEADVIRNYGFIHIDPEDGKDKLEIILRELNDYNLNGNEIRVQQSTSTVRQRPGMQGDQCYRCGQDGHWSKSCPRSLSNYRQARGLRNGSGIGPIRNSLSSFVDSYSRSTDRNNSNLLGGIPLLNRNLQNPYPQPMMPSYIQERNFLSNSNVTSNTSWPSYTSRQPLGIGSMIQNGSSTLTADYQRTLSQSNQMLVSQFMNKTDAPANGYFSNSHAGLASYDRVMPMQNNERQMLGNGMCYGNFSNSSNGSHSQMLNSNSGPSYQMSRMSGGFGPSYPGNSI